MRPYHNVIKRSVGSKLLQRLVKDINNLLKRIEDLEKANDELRQSADTYILRDQARERLFEQFNVKEKETSINT